VREAESGEVLAERYAPLGITTNNVAEYSGLIAGLAAAAELGARDVDVRMDSKLVVEQMSGRWQIKHPGLRPLAAEAAAVARGFDRVRYSWIPRERNRHADELANRAMDEAAVPAAQPAAAKPSRSWEPPAAAPIRLILVRHGETEMTAQHRYSGRGDIPLSALGQAQAQAAAARLAALAGPVAAVVTSPLLRCTQTAATIATALGGLPVDTDPDLIECDFGAWEGHTFAEVRERWPEELDRWLASTDAAPPEGESLRAVGIRVRHALARLRERYPSQWVVVVSHVSPVKLLLRDALAAGDELLYRLYLDPAGISIVDYWADGGIAVRTINDTAHVSGGTRHGDASQQRE
jgi:probable phosphoglycerate mutase